MIIEFFYLCGSNRNVATKILWFNVIVIFTLGFSKQYTISYCEKERGPNVFGFLFPNWTYVELEGATIGQILLCLHKNASFQSYNFWTCCKLTNNQNNINTYNDIFYNTENSFLFLVYFKTLEIMKISFRLYRIFFQF